MADCKLPHLHRLLELATCAQAVVRLPNGRFDLMPATSPRFSALQCSAAWSARIVGVFSPGVAIAVLREEAA